MFDPNLVRSDFPILSQPHPSGKPLVYLDSAATSQKPIQVIDAIADYYKTSNANVHRGIHYLGDKSTKAWHESRRTVAGFFGADPEEMILVRNTTEAINLVTLWGMYNYLHDSGPSEDVIVSTQMEHHSNLVPWQELTRRAYYEKNRAVRLELIPVQSDGTLDLGWFEQLVKKERNNIKCVALSHVSNTLGTINPIKHIVELTRQYCSTGKKPGYEQCLISIDGAQAAPHMAVDFHDVDVDFYSVSAHKMLGPMGIGALFVRKEILKNKRPLLTGGGMIDEVGEQWAEFAEDLEDRYTAGTPDVAGIVGWAAACTYLDKLGMDNVLAHDQELLRYTVVQLLKISEVKIVGPIIKETSNFKFQNSNLEPKTKHLTPIRCGSVAFVYEGVHAHDVAQILDSEGIAVRSGHHCTMPLHTRLGLAATTRVSFNVYSMREDVDRLIEALGKVKTIFAKDK